MEKNSGGAKPKSSTNANTNNSSISNIRPVGMNGSSAANSTQGSSSNQLSSRGSYSRRHFGENGGAATSDGATIAAGAVAGSPPRNHSSNNNSSTFGNSRNGNAGYIRNNRGSVPNSVARNRSSYDNPSHQRWRFDDAHRQPAMPEMNFQNGNPALNFNHSSSHGNNPSTVRNGLRSRNPNSSVRKTESLRFSNNSVGVSFGASDAEGDGVSLGNLDSLSPSVPTIDVLVDDDTSADSNECYDTDPDLLMVTSTEGSSVGASTSPRPVTASRDAAYARQIQQEEMDDVLRADEEFARELHNELNFFNFSGNRLQTVQSDESDSDAASPSLLPMPGQGSQMRRRFPLFGARERRRGGGGMRVFTNLPGPGRSLQFMAGTGPGGTPLMMGRRRGGNRGFSSSPDEVLPEDDFDPDERLLSGRHAEDFLSIMQDPSLMLLMLLMRTPDTVNEDGVDLDDYEGLWELAERLGEVRHRGISDDDINCIPTHTFKAPKSKAPWLLEGAESCEMGVQCQICLMDFENGDHLRSIPCNHDFHKDCIDEWLKRNATCPICRQEIKPS